MNVLFCNPPWWPNIPFSDRGDGVYDNVVRAGYRAGSRWPYTAETQSRPDHFARGEYMPYPFFMGHATTYVARETGAHCDFRDSIALRESYQSFFDYLSRKKYDYIFLESASSSWDHDSKLLLLMKKLAPDSKFVITGPISVKGEDILRDYPVHACIRGEYEKGATRVVKGESGMIDYDMLTEEEMSSSPYPYFDKEHIGHYWDHRHPIEGRTPTTYENPQAAIWASRGCPYKCIFCVWPATMTGNDPDGTGKRSVRFYSAEYIDGLVRWLIKDFGISCIYFDDDTFNLADRHVLGISKVMKEIDIPWSAMCRADTVKKETWQVMKDSGCFHVKLGFESGNQYVVDNIVNKRLNLEKAREVVFYLKEIGITVHGTFTYGLPGETKEQMLDTKRYIASMPLKTYQESGTAEMEGTPLHTLKRVKELKAYKGARIDEGYDIEGDGKMKMAKVERQLEKLAKAVG
ncbi:MAG: radical SAM protein [Alphaproteobacteria bacterium]|nr:radical SAM protein [Alphaproteobacteria bacterium]